MILTGILILPLICCCYCCVGIYLFVVFRVILLLHWYNIAVLSCVTLHWYLFVVVIIVGIDTIDTTLRYLYYLFWYLCCVTDPVHLLFGDVLCLFVILFAVLLFYILMLLLTLLIPCCDTTCSDPHLPILLHSHYIYITCLCYWLIFCWLLLIVDWCYSVILFVCIIWYIVICWWYYHYVIVFHYSFGIVILNFHYLLPRVTFVVIYWYICWYWYFNCYSMIHCCWWCCWPLFVVVVIPLLLTFSVICCCWLLFYRLLPRLVHLRLHHRHTATGCHSDWYVPFCCLFRWFAYVDVRYFAIRAIVVTLRYLLLMLHTYDLMFGVDVRYCSTTAWHGVDDLVWLTLFIPDVLTLLFYLCYFTAIPFIIVVLRWQCWNIDVGNYCYLMLLMIRCCYWNIFVRVMLLFVGIVDFSICLCQFIYHCCNHPL